jgi:hypothetical protein
VDDDTSEDVTITIVDDYEIEPTEEFYVDAFNLRPSYIIKDEPSGPYAPLDTGTITILDNDIEIIVNIDFVGGSETQTTVTLECSSGDVDMTGTSSNSKTATDGVGSTATFEVFNYDPDNFVCEAYQTSLPPPGYTDTSDSSCSIGFNDPGGTCVLQNTLNSATIEVRKEYTDGSTASVDVALNCTSGDVDGSGTSSGAGVASPGNPALFTIEGYTTDQDITQTTTGCTVTESGLASDYYQAGAVGCTPVLDEVSGAFVCTFTNAPTRATFTVIKEFNDDNPVPVEVTISCDTGLPLEQTTTITDFSSTGDDVEFVVVEFDHNQMDCDITEVVPLGYSENYESNGGLDSDQGVSACRYLNIGGGSDFSCVIENDLDQVRIDVTKRWIDDNPQFNNPTFAKADWNCYNAQFDDRGFFGCHGNDCGTLHFYGAVSTDSFYVFPDWDGSTYCSVEESVFESGVESSDNCGRVYVTPGRGNACTITNTRFYEGIPTLSQYGLAILALLMLGVGMVGFRRFV